MKRPLLWLLLFAPAVALACELHVSRTIQKSFFSPKTEIAEAGKALDPAWVGPGYSGSWFNPARAGEGFTLRCSRTAARSSCGSRSRRRAAPRGRAGSSGRTAASRRTASCSRTSTPRAARASGRRFDPAAVQLTRWGRLEFTFASCTQGSVSFQGAAGFGSGSHALTRLTTLDELSCTGTRRLTERGGRAPRARCATTPARSSIRRTAAKAG